MARIRDSTRATMIRAKLELGLGLRLGLVLRLGLEMKFHRVESGYRGERKYHLIPVYNLSEGFKANLECFWANIG